MSVGDADRTSDEAVRRAEVTATAERASRLSPSALRAHAAGDERRQRLGSRIEELRADARYSRERYDLYRAKVYGPRPTTMARLRELERARDGAEARVRRAEHADRVHKPV